MNNVQIKTMLTEQDVYSAISYCLKSDENIVFDKIFDFSLPNGAKNLEWPAKTVVEVKKRLIYDSILLIKSYFDKHVFSKLVVVVEEDNVFLKDIKEEPLKGRDVEFILFSDLQQKCSRFPKQLKQDVDGNYRVGKDENVFEKARIAVKQNRISLFLGAGVSYDSNVPLWNTLLKKLQIKNGLPFICENTSNIIRGRYIENVYYDRGNYRNFVKDIKEIIYKDVKIKGDKKNIHSNNTDKKDLIHTIATFIQKQRGNIQSIISYNYDNLLEEELNTFDSVQCCSIYEKRIASNKDKIYVYHVHGYIQRDSINLRTPIVFGEEDYHKIFQEAYNWSNVEQLQALNRSVCFFIGLSMADPNLRRLLDISKNETEGDTLHFVFLPRFEYDVKFMESIMRSFRVNCIWFDKYEELPYLIEKLIE